MKKLHFQYELQLELDRPVIDHHYRLRCLPFQNHIQNSFNLTYTVAPSGPLHIAEDGFGNRYLFGEARFPHNRFEVSCAGTVFVHEAGRKQEELHPVYRHPSAYTQPGPGIIALFDTIMEDPHAVRLVSEHRTYELVWLLMDELYHRFTYASGVTSVDTTAEEALRGGQGVCQDYAHILTALCRMANIPARYVAGMMVGEGATHAWLEAYLNGYWIGFDPTHNQLADDRFIKLSHGRDFADCTVDRGCFKGVSTQQQKIYVKVEDISW